MNIKAELVKRGHKDLVKDFVLAKREGVRAISLKEIKLLEKSAAQDVANDRIEQRFSELSIEDLLDDLEDIDYVDIDNFLAETFGMNDAEWEEKDQEELEKVETDIARTATTALEKKKKLFKKLFLEMRKTLLKA